MAGPIVYWKNNAIPTHTARSNTDRRRPVVDEGDVDPKHALQSEDVELMAQYDRPTVMVDDNDPPFLILNDIF